MDVKTTQRGRLKLRGDAGSFTAVFATFNAIDHDRDVTLPGAFRDSEGVRICGWGHKWQDLPVGRGVIHADDREAWVDGQFFLNTEAGRETYETVKGLQELQEWSYGFDVLDSEPGTFQGQKVRFLRRLKVFEVSPVLLGAGVGTRTTAIKGAGGVSVGVVRALVDIDLLELEGLEAPAPLTPAGVLADVATFAGPKALAAQLDDELTDVELKRLEERFNKAGGYRDLKATNLEVIGARWAADDGGGHSPAWVQAMVEVEVEQRIADFRARRPELSEDQARASVMAWLQSPAGTP